jgi:hypothetical protein
MEPTPLFDYSLVLYAGWCLVPPLLLFLRHFNKKFSLPNWATCIVYCLLGWVTLQVTVEIRHDYLRELVNFVPKEEQGPILEKWAADGGPKMMALFGGWLYSLVYFSIWWGVLTTFFALQKYILNQIKPS